MDQYTGSDLSFRGFLNPSKVTTPNFQFSYIHTFSPTVLNEFRAGYAGNGSDFSVDLPGVPGIGFDDGTLGFGSYNGFPQTFHENIYTYADMVSINHGKHNLKAGVDVRRNIENSNFNVGATFLRLLRLTVLRGRRAVHANLPESIQDLPETRLPTWRPISGTGGTGR